MATTQHAITAALDENYRLRAEVARVQERLQALRDETEEQEAALRALQLRIGETEAHVLRLCSNSGAGAAANSAVAETQGYYPNNATSGQQNRSTDSPDPPPGPQPPARVGRGGGRRKRQGRRAAAILSKKHKTVIALDDDWNEIWCHLCGMNAKSSDQEYFSGQLGLHSHMQHAHEEAGKVTAADILAICGRRKLSENELERLRSGELDIAKCSTKRDVIGSLLGSTTVDGPLPHPNETPVAPQPEAPLDAMEGAEVEEELREQTAFEDEEYQDEIEVPETPESTEPVQVKVEFKAEEEPTESAFTAEGQHPHSNEEMPTVKSEDNMVSNTTAFNSGLGGGNAPTKAATGGNSKKRRAAEAIEDHGDASDLAVNPTTKRIKIEPSEDDL